MLLLTVFAFAAVPCTLRAAETTPFLPDSITADLKGNITQLSEYEGPGLDSLSLKRTIYFDGGQKPVSEKTYGSDGSPAGETRFIYNEAGLTEEISGTGPDGQLRWKYTYTYAPEGKLLEEASWNGEGSLEWKDICTYTDTGLLSEKTTYKPDGSVSLQEKYEYDEERRLRTRTTLYADGKLLKRVTLSYDGSGHPAEEQRYDDSGLYEQVIHTYNEKGQLTKTAVLSGSGAVKETSVRAYTSEGSIAREKVYEPDGTVRSEISYIYDEYGNLIAQREADGGYLLREIQYGN